MKNHLKIALSLLVASVSTASLQAEQPDNTNSLWYQQPANAWEKGLPLGNGRLGLLIDGGTSTEKIIFNEDSLWSGWFEPKNDKQGSFADLQKVRKLIKEGASQGEIKKVAMSFCSDYGYGKKDFGAYQSFCNAHIEWGHDEKVAKNYRRSLDLNTALAKVSYDYEGTHYTREYFSSYPAQASVMHFSADKPGAINLTFSPSSLHKNSKVSIKENLITLEGEVDTGQKEKQGMKFQAQYQFHVKGGKISQVERTHQVVDGKKKASYPSSGIKIEGANEVTIIMVGATNYKLSRESHYIGEAPAPKNKKTLIQLKGKSYVNLKKEHLADYQNLFQRVALKIDGKDRSDLPTDQRRKEYKKTKNDPALETLMFQYGRYLMIASSRPGSMPANLQGLWSHSNSPPWNGDYHLNINFQMNYWPVDQCNLSECVEPMLRWTEDLKINGEKTAKVHYNTRGWVAHHSCNVWGYTSPGPARGIHMLEAESSAFLCQNIWDHYAYTADKKYLKETAWPLLKGAAQFWVENLQESKDGHLVVSPSYSPEWGPLSDGAYYHTMIVWDLFTDCIEASKILDTDKEFAAKLKTMRAKLQPLKVGESGQLHEWRQDKIESAMHKKKHRHMSHMWAVYPGRQIVTGQDEAMIKAAKKSMNFRGDSATGWSMGWKINIWARFLDGNRAHKLMTDFIGSRSYDNLWCAHPPFQIDGNFGYSAGVAEMLVQSHSGEINILPALPDAWKSGTVTGLKARGGITLNLTWKNGKLQKLDLLSPIDQKITVVYQGKKTAFDLKAGSLSSSTGISMD